MTVLDADARARRLDRALALGLVAWKCLVGAYVLSRGFTHVSDDDYARVTIAQRFVVAPHLDPTGTSWLPFPFWIAGSAMAVTGRSLLAARVVAFVLGALSPLPAFLVLRRAGVTREVAFFGLVIAMASPWMAWSGVATVPDGWTGALIAAAAFALIDRATLPWAALFAAMAALSRYEAWPVCGVVALRAVTLRRDAGEVRARVMVAAGAVAAPLAWLSWNRWSHGEALHFVARVSKFRAQIGAADAPLSAKLLEYPAALVDEAPEALVAMLFLALAAILAPRRVQRWTWPLLAAAACVAFLVYGDARDGAPTHHPARALLGVIGVLTVSGVDAFQAVFAAAAKMRGRDDGESYASANTPFVAFMALVIFARRIPDHPGTGDAERAPQIARGLALRGASGLDVVPCAYEHFALLAAFEKPELANVEAVTPHVGTTVDPTTCPVVRVR